MRLLNKTIWTYFLYSFVILLVAIPLFYFIIKGIVAKDVDRDLIAQKEDIVRKLDRAILFDPFDLLEALEPEIYLAPSQTIKLYDTLYTANVYNRITKEITPYRFLSSNVLIRGQYYNIQLKSSLVNNDDLIKSIVLVLTILLLLIGTGLVFINKMLSKQIWDPFYKTLGKLKNYKMEEGPVSFEETGIAEFNDLNRTIKELTERNRLVYQSQKEFIENASHEMQTPLAVLQTKLELLMQTHPLTAEQASLIGTLNDANSRLSRLNKSLLLLTKIENNQYPETEKIDIIQICQKLINQIDYQAEVKSIKIETFFSNEIMVHVNKTLIEVLISNLLANAIRYNYEGGIIKISTNKNELKIQNTSYLPALERDKIFERFHKEGNNSQSIGLGLAIARRICTLYKFKIAYNFENNSLHSFVIEFPQ